MSWRFKQAVRNLNFESFVCWAHTWAHDQQINCYPSLYYHQTIMYEIYLVCGRITPRKMVMHMVNGRHLPSEWKSLVISPSYTMVYYVHLWKVLPSSACNAPYIRCVHAQLLNKWIYHNLMCKWKRIKMLMPWTLQREVYTMHFRMMTEQKHFENMKGKKVIE
jgi:hypothetical protein